MSDTIAALQMKVTLLEREIVQLREELERRDLAPKWGVFHSAATHPEAAEIVFDTRSEAARIAALLNSEGEDRYVVREI